MSGPAGSCCFRKYGIFIGYLKFGYLGTTSEYLYISFKGIIAVEKSKRTATDNNYQRL